MTDDIQLPLLSFEERVAELQQLDLDELPPDEEMTPGEISPKVFADIRENGVLVPIIVVPAEGEVDWKYDVRDGRRRLRACRRLVAAGMMQFATIPALVYTVYDEEESQTWGSRSNALRSQSVATNLEAIGYIMDRYPEADPDTAAGRRFIARKTGLASSSIKKYVPMLKMPAVLLTGVRENAPDSTTRKKVPQGALLEIGSLGKTGWEFLVGKIDENGFITHDDVHEAKSTLTASKVADLQVLPGFEDLPIVAFAETDNEPLVDFTTSEITVSDGEGEIVSWNQSQWVENPDLVFEIVNYLRYAYENGTGLLRGMIGDNNGHNGAIPWEVAEGESHTGEPVPG
jgi:hypothetical protein